MCSTLTHASEAWTLTEPVMRGVNGFNSRCLHVITGQDYQVSSDKQPQKTTCFVRFAIAASVTSALSYACPRVEWCDTPVWHYQRAAPSTLRAAYGLPGNGDGPASGTSTTVHGIHWPNNCTETDYHCIIGPPGSEMEFIT